VRSLDGKVVEILVLANSFAATLDAPGIEEIAARADVRLVSGDSLLPP